jgi:hypothetical protein
MVGNFPQAFSHIALINTAHNIVHVLKPCHQRSAIARRPRPLKRVMDGMTHLLQRATPSC